MAYCKEVRLGLFQGFPPLKDAARAYWREESKDWRGFLDAAKLSGARLVTVARWIFQAEELENLKAPIPNDDRQRLVRAYEPHLGEMCSIELAWLDRGRPAVTYIMFVNADWYGRMLDLMPNRRGRRESESTGIYR